MKANLPQSKKNEMNQNKSRINKLQKAKDGYHQSKPPYGYSINKKTHILFPNADAQRVKRIYEHCKSSKGSNRGNISRFARAYKISRKTIYNIFKNPVYKGKVMYQGKIYDGLHKAIF